MPETWEEAQRVRRVRDLPVAQLKKIVPWYLDEELSVSEVRARLLDAGYRLSTDVLYKYLRGEGVEMRVHRGGKPWCGAPAREVAELVAYGFNRVEVARLYGVSDSTITVRLREFAAMTKSPLL